MLVLDVIMINTKTFPVWGRTHPRATKFRLRFSPSADHVLVTMPPHSTARQANAFVRKALPWLEKHYPSTPRHEEPALAARLQMGDLPSSPYVRQLGLQNLLYAFCKEQSEGFAAQLGVEIQEIRIAPTLSQWGSCSASGTLSYSARLVFCPPWVVTYVCAHEVSHLKEMNHSRAFWTLVRSLFPLYEQARLWLKNYAHTVNSQYEAL